MEIDNLLWLIPFLPLGGAAICGALHLLVLKQQKAGGEGAGLQKLASLVACAAMAGALAIVLKSFGSLLTHKEVTSLESTPWHWIDAGSFTIELSMVFDRLSSVMCMIITGVGLLIHIYSTGYMKGDGGYAKFFAYLNLFCFAMLMLVLSSSLLGLFVGWEGVGLCSYLLIGFWYDKGWPAEAGQKAFVVNRIGDACFLVGSFLLIKIFGSLDLSDVAGSVSSQMGEHPVLISLAALMLFGGACGKSAQFPLFTWLPDAMAGPTPVSALIHAATMVTAGVYLILRLNPLYAAAPNVLVLIGLVGALTAFIGASSAMYQKDIKKVLAYSTVSQLGYMFLGLSTGAWGAALFHLMTHAFFKGLLFLGSGSVILGMHHEQDMYKMGGLRKHMPKTFITFMVGAAALSGLPLMSGFFSKDEILAHAFAHGGISYFTWIIGLLAAMMTAYYTWRMVALTFFGKERFDVDHVHPHESPASMTTPLIVLAVLALFGGLLNLPALHLLGDAEQLLAGWIGPVTAAGNEILHGEHGAPHLGLGAEFALLGLGCAIALFFAHKGFHGYRQGTQKDADAERANPALFSFLSDAWRIDSTYAARVVAPIKSLATYLATIIDQDAIDHVVNGVGAGAGKTGEKLRVLIDGNLKNYALWMGAGAALLTLTWLWN
jgi:NADH-quinone oxidoreductase subunit L